MDKKIEFVLNHTNKHSKNLNKVFDGYGLNTLEAQVPFVDKRDASQIAQASDNEQKRAKKILQNESARAAVDGRVARTRNKVIRLVEIDGQTMLELGETRDRSPVDKSELDKDIDDYMSLRRSQRILNPSCSNKISSDVDMPDEAEKKPTILTNASRLISLNRLKKEELPTRTDLDNDLDEYRKEIEAQKTRSKRCDELVNRQSMEDYDWD